MRRPLVWTAAKASSGKYSTLLLLGPYSLAKGREERGPIHGRFKDIGNIRVTEYSNLPGSLVKFATEVLPHFAAVDIPHGAAVFPESTALCLNNIVQRKCRARSRSRYVDQNHRSIRGNPQAYLLRCIQGVLRNL